MNKLLIIDDEKDIRFLVSSYFQELDFEVIEAEDGESGINLFKKEKPDIILCDLRMPGISGLEVISTIKEISNLTPIIVVSGTGLISDAIEAVRLGAWDYVLKPIHDMVILKYSIEKALEKSELLRKNENYRERLEILVEKRTSELKMALDGIIQVMLSSLEFKDPYTASHQRRVAELSKLIAIEMGVDKHSLESIYRSAIIHDIGKISIPAEILTKPTKLTDIEFELIKSHAQIGYDILKDIKFPWKLADIVHQHHEKLDGSGYPNGTRGDEILPEAKIITVADIVEAMGSQRPYRAAIDIEIVYNEIESNKGKYYDPLVVEKCLKILKTSEFKL